MCEAHKAGRRLLALAGIAGNQTMLAALAGQHRRRRHAAWRSGECHSGRGLRLPRLSQQASRPRFL